MMVLNSIPVEKIDVEALKASLAEVDSKGFYIKKNL